MPHMGIWCCCGCAKGVPCTHCTPSPPAEFSVTISGLTLCGCVDYVGGSEAFTYTSSDVLNTTHTLSQSTCVWVVSSAVTGLTFTDYFGGSSCSGSPTPSAEQFSITLTRFASKWRLTISTLFSGQPLFFDEQPENASADCVTVPTFTNDYVVGGCAAFGQAGYGGTATVVCV